MENNAKPIPAGKDNEGDELFIGTDKEWDAFDKADEDRDKEKEDEANQNAYYDEQRDKEDLAKDNFLDR